MKTVKLKFPIESAGQKISELKLRRPKAADLEVMDTAIGEISKTILLIANLTERSPEEIRLLDAADYMTIQEEVQGFLDGKSITGQ